LVPASHRINGNHYWGEHKFHELRQNGEYIRSDLITTAHRLQELQNDIAQGKVGSQETFEAFVRRTEERVIEAMKVIPQNIPTGLL